ncbi:LacI family DNA-binding transcriptional regulator [Cohnella cholangitidis]|uniref:LacI family transcriptional regulator n=1 Tax=Cohnella cholangitidis TaxID=2598458 RepID=A0A7G5C411_9BACL|nr:LacI family DNA-binding transcriptional regulator [Cohnella cholangitidis]QMV43945.1 LacI family transcriptional regulator [Cohnella cholangitidis]
MSMRKVTMQQIADYVGVSKFAVSKALSGKSGVSTETREKIIQSATQLGYFAQKKTRPSAKRNTEKKLDQKDTIVVLIPNIRYQNRQSYYWGRILDGITAVLDSNRLGMVIVTEHVQENLAKLINPEGVVGLIGVGLISNQLLLDIRNWGVPFVLIDHEDPLIPSDVLFMNNYECSRRIANYLAGIGHARFQFVGNIRYSHSFYDRWLGFRSILEESNIPLNQNAELLALEGDNRSEITDNLHKILKKMQENGELPTSFVCANDSLAICVMTVLTRLGVDVPSMCSVTGFDDIEDAVLAQPSLSTVHVNKEALGYRAVEMLLRRVGHPDSPKEKILLTGDFILRDSTGKAPSTGSI